MHTFFLKTLGARPQLLGTSFSFLLTLLGGWFLLIPAQTPPHVSHIFFGTLLVFCLQNVVQTTLNDDIKDGSLINILASPAYLGTYLFARFVSFLCFGTLIVMGGLLVQGLFMGSINCAQGAAWLLCVPGLLGLIFFATILSLLTRASFLMGVFLSYPLMIPLFILTVLAENETKALMALGGICLILVPLTLMGAHTALRMEKKG